MKCAFPVRRGFGSVDVEVPNFCIEDFALVMERIREESFGKLRRRFQRVMREWPRCPLHGLALLFPTYAITAAGRLLTVLAYGCGVVEPTAEEKLEDFFGPSPLETHAFEPVYYGSGAGAK